MVRYQTGRLSLRLVGIMAVAHLKWHSRLPTTGTHTHCKTRYLFLVLEAKDSPANLATALNPYQEQVKLLSSMQHNQYTLRVVLFGDYEFQTHNYGLSGSSGVHP